MNTVITQIGAQLLLQPVTGRWGEAVGYWLSSGIMFLLTGILSFVLNRKFSFRSKAPLPQSAVRFAAVLVICYAVSFGLSDMVVPPLLDMLFAQPGNLWKTRISMLAAQVVYTLLNYALQRLWAFKE